MGELGEAWASLGRPGESRGNLGKLWDAWACLGKPEEARGGLERRGLGKPMEFRICLGNLKRTRKLPEASECEGMHQEALGLRVLERVGEASISLGILRVSGLNKEWKTIGSPRRHDKAGKIRHANTALLAQSNITPFDAIKELSKVLVLFGIHEALHLDIRSELISGHSTLT